MASSKRNGGLMDHDPFADLDALDGPADDLVDNIGEKSASPGAEAPAAQEPVQEAVETVEASEQANDELPEGDMTETKADSSIQEGGVFDLGGSLSIADVGDCYTSLQALLEKGGDISVSGDSLSQVDGAGLQLLVAFYKESVRRQMVVSWHGDNTLLREMAAESGLSGALGFE